MNTFFSLSLRNGIFFVMFYSHTILQQMVCLYRKRKARPKYYTIFSGIRKTYLNFAESAEFSSVYLDEYFRAYK